MSVTKNALKTQHFCFYCKIFQVIMHIDRTYYFDFWCITDEIHFFVKIYYMNLYSKKNKKKQTKNELLVDFSQMKQLSMGPLLHPKGKFGSLRFPEIVGHGELPKKMCRNINNFAIYASLKMHVYHFSLF